MSLKNAVWLLSMGIFKFVIMLPGSSYIAAAPIIRNEWGLNNTQVGLVAAAMFLGYAFAALLVIPMTDRFKPSSIFIGSTVLFAAANLLFPLLARDFGTGLILRVLAGVAMVGVYMPGVRIVSERFSERSRGLAVGLWVTATYIGYSGSLGITGGLMVWLDWVDAYTLLALISAFAIPLAFILVKSYRHTAAGPASGKLELAVLKDPKVRYLIIGYTMHAVQLQSVRVWLPLFLVAMLTARGFGENESITTAATLASVSLILGSIGPFTGGIISDKFGRIRTSVVILTISASCSFAIGWGFNLPWVFILTLLLVYGWSISADSAIYSTGLTEVAAADRLGSVQAAQAFLAFIGGAMGPFAVGLILDFTDDSIRWVLGFSMVGLLALLAIPGLLKLRSTPLQKRISP